VFHVDAVVVQFLQLHPVEESFIKSVGDTTAEEPVS
jgi:hypothetical protein